MRWKFDQTRVCVMDSSKNSASSTHSGQPAMPAASDFDEQLERQHSRRITRRLSASRAKLHVSKEGRTRHVVSSININFRSSARASMLYQNQVSSKIQDQLSAETTFSLSRYNDQNMEPRDQDRASKKSNNITYF